jgi:hypothetical protein
MSIETIRNSFRPKNIKILFVGESPPRSGGFFYGNPEDFSPMTKYYQKVFEKVFETTFSTPKDFLDFFKLKGCYLDDICHEPVDDLPPRERRLAVINGVDKLAERIRDYKPEHAVAILIGIHGYVEQAVKTANLQINIQAVPFAGMGHQTRFENELTRILKGIYAN